MGVGVEPQMIYAQLKGIRCPGSAVDRGDRVLSCADAIATALKREFGLSESERCANEAVHAEEFLGEEEEVTAVVSRDAIH